MTWPRVFQWLRVAFYKSFIQNTLYTDYQQEAIMNNGINLLTLYIDVTAFIRLLQKELKLVES